MHEKGTSGVDSKDAGLRILQGGRSPWDPGQNICLQPHKEVFPHSLESLLSALRDGKGHLTLGKPTGFVFCSKHKVLGPWHKSPGWVRGHFTWWDKSVSLPPNQAKHVPSETPQPAADTQHCRVKQHVTQHTEHVCGVGRGGVIGVGTQRCF